MNQTIKCNVESCKYNENSSDCTLSSIAVGNDPMADTYEAHTKEETECTSFEVK